MEYYIFFYVLGILILSSVYLSIFVTIKQLKFLRTREYINAKTFFSKYINVDEYFDKWKKVFKGQVKAVCLSTAIICIPVMAMLLLTFYSISSIGFEWWILGYSLEYLFFFIFLFFRAKKMIFTFLKDRPISTKQSALLSFKDVPILREYRFIIVYKNRPITINRKMTFSFNYLAKEMTRWGNSEINTYNVIMKYLLRVSGMINESWAVSTGNHYQIKTSDNRYFPFTIENFREHVLLTINSIIHK